MSNTFTEMEIDIMKEIINIGGGNVATSISNMFGKKVHMELPFITQMTYDEIFASIMPAEEIVKAVQMEVDGAIKGQFLLLLDEEGLIKFNREHEKLIQDNEELANSAVCELANILVNQFIQAIVKLFDVPMSASVPYLTEDMFGSLLSSAYMEEFQYDDYVWIFKNEYWIEDEKWDSSLYFVPQAGVLEKFLNYIREKGEI